VQAIEAQKLKGDSSQQSSYLRYSYERFGPLPHAALKLQQLTGAASELSQYIPVKYRQQLTE
jgi:hypothetical protein